MYCFHKISDAKTIAMAITQSQPIAFFVCISLFIVKCFVPYFPIGCIYIFCGYTLDPCLALITCTAGNALCFSFSYIEGRKSKTKSPLIAIVAKNEKSGFVPALFIHCIKFFPCHSAGIYMGAVGLPFRGYLLGSIIGATPTVLLSLSIADALPHFTFKLCLSLVAVILVTIICCIYQSQQHIEKQQKARY